MLFKVMLIGLSFRVIWIPRWLMSESMWRPPKVFTYYTTTHFYCHYEIRTVVQGFRRQSLVKLLLCIWSVIRASSSIQLPPRSASLRFLSPLPVRLFFPQRRPSPISHNNSILGCFNRPRIVSNATHLWWAPRSCYKDRRRTWQDGSRVWKRIPVEYKIST